MKLRTKLLLTQAPLAISLLVVAAVSLGMTRSLDDHARLILRRNYRHGLNVNEMVGTLDRMQAAITLGLLGGAPPNDEWQADRTGFEQRLLVHEHEGIDQTEATVVAPVRSHWQSFLQQADELRAAPHDAQPRLFLSQVAPELDALRVGLGQLGQFHDDHMRARASSAESFARVAMTTVVLVSALALVLGWLAASRLLRQIAGPLQQLAAAAGRIQEGDFEVRLDVRSKDEMGGLARTFSEMAASLRRYRELSVDQLLQLKHALQTAVDSIPDPVLVFRADRSLVTFNRAATTLLGLHAGPEGDPAPLPDPAQRAVERARDHVLAGHGTYAPAGFEGAVQLDTASGPAVLLARGTPIVAEGGAVEGANVMLLDVTGLRRFDQLKNDFVATVAHELRTPLTSLQLAIGLCEEQVAGPTTAQQSKLLGEARQDCERLRAMVSDLLDLARLEGGRLALQLERVPISRLVQRAIEDHAAVAEQQHVSVVADVTDELGEIAVDPERIALVLSNLVSNSLCYTDPGGCVTVRARQQGERVRFEVEDNGRGIAAEHLERVFEKFYRPPNSAPGGAGLGLWIARQIVQAHGGELGARSEVGAGSLFWFELADRG